VSARTFGEDRDRGGGVVTARVAACVALAGQVIDVRWDGQSNGFFPRSTRSAVLLFPSIPPPFSAPSAFSAVPLVWNVRYVHAPVLRAPAGGRRK